MQALIALFAAAAMVFAPGAIAAGPGAHRPDSGDLAGRILAPTFDEANVASQAEAGAHKRLQRGKSRIVSAKAFAAWSPQTSPSPAAPELWAAAFAGLLLFAGRRASTTRIPRAPPHLLTV